MKKFIYVLLSVLILAILYYFFVGEPKKRNHENENYLKNLKLELKGNVTKSKNIGHGVYILTLDVKKTNIDFYHPQDSLKYYLCRIDKNKAELIISDPSEKIIIGDSVVISSEKDSCYIFTVNKILKDKWKLEIISYVEY
jgi:hypothetical protein